MAKELMEKDDISKLDLLIFITEGRKYAINVSKVQEIIAYAPLTSVPCVHPYVEGVFMPRGELISVLDMKRVLQLGEAEAKGNIIIANFSAQSMAFHVDAVDGIFTTTWQDIMRPSESFGDAESGLSTGIVKRNGELIVILDFEKILSDINPAMELRAAGIYEIEGGRHSDIPILVVEDSAMLNRLIVESLEKAGYTNITHTANGQEAWDMIKEWRDEGSLESHVQCVITDIEMPKMDGHSLIKLMKEDFMTQPIKVIIFSSIINDVERAKGEKLGVDAQLSKPEIDQLVEKLDQIMDASSHMELKKGEDAQ